MSGCISLPQSIGFRIAGGSGALHTSKSAPDQSVNGGVLTSVSSRGTRTIRLRARSDRIFQHTLTYKTYVCQRTKEDSSHIRRSTWNSQNGYICHVRERLLSIDSHIQWGVGCVGTCTEKGSRMNRTPSKTFSILWKPVLSCMGNPI